MKVNLFRSTVSQHLGIKKLTPIVRIHTQQGKRQQATRSFESLDDRMLAAIPQRRHPPQAVAISVSTRVCRNAPSTLRRNALPISLQKAGLDIIPIGKCPYRHLMLEEGAAFGRTDPPWGITSIERTVVYVKFCKLVEA